MYDPKKSWMWGRAFRTYPLNEFAPGLRLSVPASYTDGEGVANEDAQGALRLANGQQVGRVNRDTGEVLIGRKLREGDLPRGPRN
ncbi:hypothetical protein PGB34_13165 [Xenophilus arseniciresistens]|uniref:Uncharacterized protein n=1 Tax=Xenophilus arseniciresistens TaxID=1283306 RepID=A0AAE3N9W1_9BURK|nr:hypothetical protein [Xenophilus arseniciresistens]MDA7417313.1 hypothetical protein [Xenophilus arseniciresistens]